MSGAHLPVGGYLITVTFREFSIFLLESRKSKERSNQCSVIPFHHNGRRKNDREPVSSQNQSLLHE